MPRLFNPQRKTEPVTLADGTSLHIRAKARVYVSPDKMTGILWGMVRSGRLVNRGGDPRPAPPPSPPKSVTPPLPKAEAKTDTSSSHHQSRDRVTLKSSEIASVKKEEKADKKQSDSDNKAVTHRNGRTKTEIDSADSKPKRRRRKKKSDG